MYTAYFYSLVVNNVEELKLLFYPNPTPLRCTGSWRQSSVHSVNCRLRCLLFREEDAYTYLPGASLNVVVKINLIFPGIELQSLNFVFFLLKVSLFLKWGGGGSVFGEVTRLEAVRSGRQGQKTDACHNASRPVVRPT